MNLLSANQHVVLKWVEAPDEGFGSGVSDFVRILSDGKDQAM